MSWLTNNNQVPHGESLARLWREPGIVAIPGAHNPLCALLARKAGFKALYLSGAALSASLGLPDLGVLTLEELGTMARAIVRVAGLPLIVDCDTGFGGVLNVMRAVREMEDAGAAAIQIEDQVSPKKCGHLSGKRVVPPVEMAARITAAAKARRHLRIIARTDAVEPEGLDAAIERGRIYLDAGADAIFPEALTSEAGLHKFAQGIAAPLLANMTEFGRTPYLSAQRFEELGYKMVIWPVSSLRVAAKAVEQLYDRIAREGAAAGMLDRMQTRTELYELIGYSEFEALDRSIAAGRPTR